MAILDAESRAQIALNADLPKANEIATAATTGEPFLGFLSYHSGFDKPRYFKIFSLKTGRLLHQLTIPNGGNFVRADEKIFRIPIANNFEGVWQTGLVEIDAETGAVTCSE